MVIITAIKVPLRKIFVDEIFTGIFLSSNLCLIKKWL
jgi:hypothetical protein